MVYSALGSTIFAGVLLVVCGGFVAFQQRQPLKSEAYRKPLNLVFACVLVMASWVFLEALLTWLEERGSQFPAWADTAIAYGGWTVYPPTIVGMLVAIFWVRSVSKYADTRSFGILIYLGSEDDPWNWQEDWQWTELNGYRPQAQRLQAD